MARKIEIVWEEWKDVHKEWKDVQEEWKDVHAWSIQCWTTIFKRSCSDSQGSLGGLGHISMVIEGEGPFCEAIGRPNKVSIKINSTNIFQRTHWHSQRPKHTRPRPVHVKELPCLCLVLHGNFGIAWKFYPGLGKVYPGQAWVWLCHSTYLDLKKIHLLSLA